MPIVACSFDECERPQKTRDWCHAHYEYLRSNGNLPDKPCKGCGKPCPGRRHYCSDACLPRCAVEECSDAAKSRGWCTLHYTRWQLTGDPAQMYDRLFYAPGQLCAFEGCGNVARKVGYCSGHYDQHRKGRELRPLAYKSKSTTCAFCGGPSGIKKGYRKVCSSLCNVMLRKHGGPLPDTFNCIICGDDFPFVVAGRRRVKSTTKKCTPCRQASMKHGYSPKQLANRDGTDCGLCGAPVNMTLKHPNLMRGSVDHITPTSLGGSNEPDNVQLAHLHCNIKKNNRVDIAA